MPIVKSSKDKNVPPVVGMARKVNFTNKPALGNLTDVDEECDYNENVHPDDARNEDLKEREKSNVTADQPPVQSATHIDHCVLISAHLKVPMEGWNYSKSRPWNKHCDLDIVFHL